MSFPIAIEKYKELPFDLYSAILPSYYWLDEAFTTCYRFMPSVSSGQIKGRLLKMESSGADAAVASFDDEYTMEYNHEKTILRINFMNDFFDVEDIQIFYGTITAIVLSLVGTNGIRRTFYAATSHPFSSVYRKIYDV
jgi:hypothetical protein